MANKIKTIGISGLLGSYYEKWPRQESNLNLELRKLLYYPLYDEASWFESLWFMVGNCSTPFQNTSSAISLKELISIAPIIKDESAILSRSLGFWLMAKYYGPYDEASWFENLWLWFVVVRPHSKTLSQRYL